MSDDDRRRRETARRQGGLLHRTQLLAIGISDDALRYRVRKARWQRVLPGVYATFSGKLTPAQRKRAALLYAGRRSQLASLSACRQYGLAYLPKDDGWVHVMVPHECHRKSIEFVVIERTTRFPVPCNVGGLPVCPAPRAVIDACRALTSLRDVRALMADAVNRRRVEAPQLERELQLGCSAGSALPRQALTDVHRGCRSAPECEMRDLFKRSTVLPEPSFNAPVYDDGGRLLGYADALFADVGVAVEMNSREWHLDGDRFEGTMRRASIFAAAGIEVVPVSPSRMRRDGAAFLREVEQTYLRRLRKL